MKRFSLTLALLVTLFAAIIAPFVASAERPNPPAISGSVPIGMFITPPGSTNSVAVAPRIHVLDEHGREVADIETTVAGTSGVFHITLKKAGTYAIWAYYPAPSQLNTTPQLVDVLRKQTSTVNLTWPPQGN